MANEKTADYGPLKKLFGTWKGTQGINVSPEPDEDETIPYYETIVFEPGGDVDNAEVQSYAIARYRLLVMRKSNDEIFHDQVGYWLWDKDHGTIIHSFTIPRGMAVLAGGTFDPAKANDAEVTFKVAAKEGGEWGIVQAPFMKKNARSTAFEMTMTVNENTLSYSEITTIDIYGRTVQHTDDHVLEKVK